MINLKVANYCHTCPDFEAHVQKSYYDGKVKSTDITCVYEVKCERIYEHIKDEERKAAAVKFDLY